MCRGGRLLADFTAGTTDEPVVPDTVGAALTQTVEGLWVIWARKVAHWAGDGFQPITHRGVYPADAVASCGLSGAHRAPDLACTCGFHALTGPWSAFPALGPARLDVVLTGRILAFEFGPNRVLFRAERQTVISAVDHHRPSLWIEDPPDAAGALAHMQHDRPRDGGRLELQLPREPQRVVAIGDDAGACVSVPGVVPRRADAFELRRRLNQQVNDRPDVGPELVVP